MDGWEVFKPYAIISITVAVVAGTRVVGRVIRYDYAIVVTLATAAASLAYSPPSRTAPSSPC